MSLFDIVGPVMVGPSSSHTAGAVKIGNIALKLLADRLVDAQINFHGSFLLTGKGHGTDKAVLAGLLGMCVDDPRIPDSYQVAAEKGVSFAFGAVDLGDAHPNTVQLILTGKSGKELEVIACSTGGGRIMVCQVDGMEARFCGDYPTLIVHNMDEPGHVAEITSMLAHKSVNIATMQMDRDQRGGRAVLVLECDKEVPVEGRRFLERLEGIIKVTYLSLETDVS